MDMGDLSKNTPDYIVIDWAATAKNMQVGYYTVTINNDTYWYRT